MSRRIGHRLERALLPMVPHSQKLPVRYRLRKLLGTIDPLISQIAGLARGSGRTIDVGANDGMFCYAFSRFAARVDAFEPQPNLARQIDSFGVTSRRNITVHNCGLSDVSGTMTLHVPLIARRFRKAYEVTGLATFRTDTSSPVSTQRLIDVPVKRLDDFNFRDVTLIKIDVEGHEAQVIDGAIETLEHCRPVIVVELERRHVGNKCMLDTIDRLQSLCYSGYFVDHGMLVSIDDFDIIKHQAEYLETEARDEAYLAGRYINNFIFKPLLSSDT